MIKVAFVFLAILTSACSFAQISQLGCFPYPKTISVTGSAEINIIPDEIYVQVQLKEYKKKNENKTELDGIKTVFLASCRALGIADSNISVASFDGYNMSSAWRSKKKDPDLLASIIYQIKFSSTNLIEELADKLDDEATASFGITHTAHSKVAEYRKQLKIRAVKAAREKAQYLAESINEEVGPAITVDEPEEFEGSEQRRQGANRLTNASLSNTGYNYETDKSAVDYRKIQLRFEVKAVFALK